MYGGALAAELRRRLGEGAELFGMGGPAMQKAGVSLIVDIADSSVMGFVEVLGAVPALLRRRRFLFQQAKQRRPDGAVLIDFPGFHMGLARKLRRIGIPVVYFIPPKAWAWRPRRARRIARTTDRVLCIFPFSAEFYQRAGANVVYVGHPLVSLLSERSLPSPQEARQRLGLLEGAPVLGLFPGSRRTEVERLLPPMVDAAAHLSGQVPGLRCVLALAPTLSESVLAPLTGHPFGDQVRVVRGESQTVMRASTVLLAKSGTTTLEATLLGVPMVVAYKMAPLTFWLVRRLVRVPYSALPNLVLGREVVPELYQEEVTGERLAELLLPLLTDSDAAEAQRRELAEAAARLGPGDAIARAADAVLELLDGAKEP